MNQEHKDENEKKKMAYRCEVCKKEYSLESAEAQKGICCKTLLTPLEELYRRDPSPKGA